MPVSWRNSQYTIQTFTGRRAYLSSSKQCWTGVKLQGHVFPVTMDDQGKEARSHLMGWLSRGHYSGECVVWKTRAKTDYKTHFSFCFLFFPPCLLLLWRNSRPLAHQCLQCHTPAKHTKTYGHSARNSESTISDCLVFFPKSWIKARNLTNLSYKEPTGQHC